MWLGDLVCCGKRFFAALKNDRLPAALGSRSGSGMTERGVLLISFPSTMLRVSGTTLLDEREGGVTVVHQGHAVW